MSGVRTGRHAVVTGPPPGGGAATIHNYLLDGSGENAAQIDNGQDFESNLTFYDRNANETIQQVAPGNGSAHAVEVVTGGSNQSDGLVINNTDVDSPIGLYFIGFDVKTPDGPTSLTILFASPTDQTQATVSATTSWQRVTLGLYLNQPGFMRCFLSQNNATASPTRIWVDNAMLTEGSAATFADGDSDGWAWSGTPHASVSSGPQP